MLSLRHVQRRRRPPLQSSAEAVQQLQPPHGREKSKSLAWLNSGLVEAACYFLDAACLRWYDFPF